MAPFGTGYRVASSSCDASLGGGSFINGSSFDRDNVLLFYVGASRARIKLEITAVLSDEDCKDILSSVLNYQGKIRRAKKDLAGALNAIGSLNS